MVLEIVGVADSGIELDHGCFRHNGTSIGEIGMNHRKVVLVNTTIDDGDHQDIPTSDMGPILQVR